MPKLTATKPIIIEWISAEGFQEFHLDPNNDLLQPVHVVSPPGTKEAGHEISSAVPGQPVLRLVPGGADGKPLPDEVSSSNRALRRRWHKSRRSKNMAPLPRDWWRSLT